MKIQNAILFASSLILLLVSACQKDDYVPTESHSCTIDPSSHPKNQEYQSLIDEYTSKGIVGLSAIISQPEETAWIGASGYAYIEDQQTMTPCHLHHTASLAKSFTAVVILQLVQEGQLDFDTKIEPLLPDEIHSSIPNLSDLTIKHLLQQTSGIPDIFDIEFFTDLMNDPEKEYSSLDLLKRNKGVDALSAPGAEFHYSDPNFMLLSLIIDGIEGGHIKAFKNRIFEPLALVNTYYHTDEYPMPKGVVGSYWDQYNNGAIENVSDLQTRLTNYIKGSDGIIASPADMTTFYRAVFDGQLLGEEMLELIKTDWVVEEDENRMNTHYSHGFMVIDAEGETWIGHTGLQIGASCYVYYNINTGSTISVFTNTGTAFFVEKMALIYSDLWNDLKDVVK